MESIILLVLFGIVSSVFQAVIKSSKQQKRAEANAQGIRPKVRPTYEAASKSYISMEPKIVQDEKPIEVFENVVIQDQVAAPSTTPRFMWMDDITFDDLQRSIIMAEVLGKPKALRKTTR